MSVSVELPGSILINRSIGHLFMGERASFNWIQQISFEKEFPFLTSSSSDATFCVPPTFSSLAVCDTCLQLGRSSVQTTWLPVVVWNPHPQRVQTRPDDKSWIKLSKKKKEKEKKERNKKITESVPSFSQSKTRTGGCFVKMISERSVKVKHKAEVKDKHNSCVLSASGDEPNLTSRTAAWQPEINAHVPLPLEWCASDFFIFFLKIWSYSRFIFFLEQRCLGS